MKIRFTLQGLHLLLDSIDQFYFVKNSLHKDDSMNRYFINLRTRLNIEKPPFKFFTLDLSRGELLMLIDSLDAYSYVKECLQHDNSRHFDVLNMRMYIDTQMERGGE